MKQTLFVLMSSAMLCEGQGTFTIAFDEPPLLGAGEVRSTEEYVESGMRFRELYGSPSSSRVARMRGPYGSFPDNGTIYFGGSTSITNVTMFSLVSGDSFSLESVQLADFYANSPDKPDDVRFIGHRADGSTVTTDIILQHLETDSRAAFQTSYFGPEFMDLAWVEIPTQPWWMDNLVFSTIPEPSASALMLFAGGLLAFSRRVRHAVGRDRATKFPRADRERRD